MLKRYPNKRNTLHNALDRDKGKNENRFKLKIILVGTKMNKELAEK